jgi:hypothetical protein
VYADFNLESATLDTLNTAAVFVTDDPAKRARIICPLSKSDDSHYAILSHGLSFNTITIALTGALQIVNKRKKHSVLPIEFLSM